jgi:hypothetical protein
MKKMLDLILLEIFRHKIIYKFNHKNESILKF